MVFIRRRLRFRSSPSGGWAYLFEQQKKNRNNGANLGLGVNIDGFKPATWSGKSSGLSCGKILYKMNERDAKTIIKKLEISYNRQYDYQIIEKL